MRTLVRIYAVTGYSVDEDWTTVEDPEREGKLDSWYREWYEENGHPVQTDDDTEEQAVEDEVKENLEKHGIFDGVTMLGSPSSDGWTDELP